MRVAGYVFCRCGHAQDIHHPVCTEGVYACACQQFVVVADALAQATSAWLSRHEANDAELPVVRRRAANVEQYGVRMAPNKHGEPGTWWPMPSEVRACCAALEVKARKAICWPLTNVLLEHCGSYRHVAALYEVDVGELKRSVAATRAMRGLKGG